MNLTQNPTTNQENEMLARCRQASPTERAAVIRQIDAFLPVLRSNEEKTFWLKVRQKIERIGDDSKGEKAESKRFDRRAFLKLGVAIIAAPVAVQLAVEASKIEAVKKQVEDFYLFYCGLPKDSKQKVLSDIRNARFEPKVNDFFSNLADVFENCGGIQ